MLKATGRNLASGIAITACVGAGGTQPKLCPPQMASPAAEKYRKTTQGERKLMSPAEHCLSSQLQAKSDLPGGCCVVGRQATSRKKDFAFLFNFHLCNENLINAHFLSSTTFPFSTGKTAV